MNNKVLAPEQIQLINNYLENTGVNYLDIRYEMTDHVATVMEQKSGNFETELKEYIKDNRKQLKKLNRNMAFAGMRKAYKELGLSLLRPLPIIGSIAVFAVAMLLLPILGQERLVQILFLLFILITSIPTFSILHRMFRYRKQYSGGIGYPFLVLGLLYLYAFKDYLPGTIVVLYQAIMVVCAVVMLVTAKKQYKRYKLRYE